MARIGLKNFRYSLLDENEQVTIPKTLGKAVDCQPSLELNSSELYADDTLAESDYSFKKGTITLSVDDDDDKTFAEILGHEISESGEVLRKDTDVPPYLALGRILTKVVNNVRKYKVEIFNKVKFQDTMPNETTNGESITYTTPSITGTISKLKDGTWSTSNTFTDYDEASEYLDDCLTGTSKPSV